MKPAYLALVGLSAMAQTIGLPQYGLLLEGTANEPKLINNSSHQVVAYALIYDNRGTSTVDLLEQLRTKPASEVGIAPGRTLEVNRPHLGASGGGGGRGVPVGPQVKVRGGNGLPPEHTTAALDAVLFEDGQLVGPDHSGQYERLTSQIKQEQEVASILLNTTDRAAAWVSIQSIASSPEPPPPPPAPGRYGVRAGPMPPWRAQFARQLLLVRQRQGDAAAVKAAESTKNYPVIVKVE
jgi:hypothetical protein